MLRKHNSVTEIMKAKEPAMVAKARIRRQGTTSRRQGPKVRGQGLKKFAGKAGHLSAMPESSSARHEKSSARPDKFDHHHRVLVETPRI